VCPANGHTLLVTRAVKRSFPYRASNPLESLRSAIEKADPDIVIPCCDRSVEHLHQLYGNALKLGAEGEKIARLIERSLGDPSGYRIVTSRYDLLALAQEEGVSVPETTRVSSSADLDLWRTSKSNACVVKVDGTWGGLGVRTLRESDPSERVWDEVTNTSRLTRAIKRLMVNRDPFFLSAWLNHTERPIIAQKFVEGRPANCTVFAWKGKVVALIAVEVLRSDGSTGPASVVHLIQNAEMRGAAERIAARLGMSGFFGLDFILEETTGQAYLIEMNARLAPPCYLRFEKGRDLIGAMWASVTGQPIPENVRVTESDIIAYQRPTARRDGTPANCFYLEPEGEPELARELQNPFPNRTVLFRLVQFLTPTRDQPDQRLASNG
jgi:glutathione synthase/RimK-type ligase-like ATP-grasp enzyme